MTCWRRIKRWINAGVFDDLHRILLAQPNVANEMTGPGRCSCYGRVDLLEIDELGYVELDRRGVEMLFQSLPMRHSPAGAGPSPTHGSAQRSRTA